MPGLPLESCAASLRSGALASVRSPRNISICPTATGAKWNCRQRERMVCSTESGVGASRMSVALSGGSSRIFRNRSASFQRMVCASSKIKMRRRPCGLKYAARCTARNWPTRIMGRATGARRRTGSGTSSHTSGCGSIISGIRSTIEASADSPRSVSPAATNEAGSGGGAMRLQDLHSPQKSSCTRSQFAACANMRASVYLPIPRGPVKSSAPGARSRRSIPRSAVTIRSFPRNSLKPMGSAADVQRGEHTRFDRGQDLLMNFFRSAQGSGLLVVTFDLHPVGLARQLVVNIRSRAQMLQIRFLQVAAQFGVLAFGFFTHQAVRFFGGHAQVDHQVFGRQREQAIFEFFEPRQKFAALGWRNASALMRQVGRDVTVCEQSFTRCKIRFQGWTRFAAVFCVKQRGEMRVDRFQRAEFAVEETRHELAEKSVVAREAHLREGDAAC